MQEYNNIKKDLENLGQYLEFYMQEKWEDGERLAELETIIKGFLNHLNADFQSLFE